MSTNPSPALAALLSFLFPGLGQFYAGDLRKAVLWALPMLLFILGVIWLLLGGSQAMLAIASDAGKWVGLLVLNVAFFLYHAAAMIDAYAVAKAERYRGLRSTSASAPIALAVLVALTMILHGVPEVVGVNVNNFLDAFGGHNVIPSFSLRPSQPPTVPPSTTPSPDATGTPVASVTPTVAPSGSGGPEPSATPRVCNPIDLTPWRAADDGRLNILITGSDSRSDEGSSAIGIRTDSMMLLSVDIASCKAALFSFPRNMQQVPSKYPDWLRIPLENGGDFPGMLSSLWNTAAGPSCQVNFDCDTGWRALTFAIQSMANVPLDGVVAVNLKGFVALVGALPDHGVWIDVPYALHDDVYHNSLQQPVVVDFQPGCQFLDPEEALAFARSRHQDSDYQRARRQQIFLQQVRRQLDPLALLGSLDDLLSAAQQNLYMTFERSDIQYLAQVASRVDADRLYRFDFAPNQLKALASMDGMAAKIQNIFDEPEPEPDPDQQQDPCPPRS